MSLGYTANMKNSGNTGIISENDEILVQFDSGEGVTLDDALCHTVVTGTTGSFKTWSLIYPALRNMLRANLGGLIVDIKGNMHRTVAKIAESCERKKDIVEYGTEASAIPMNIINGMDRFRLYNFLQTITLESFDNASHNKDFHIKGVNIAADCGELLRLLAEYDSAYTPTLALIAEMVNDYSRAGSLYSLFMDQVYDSQREDHDRLVHSVKNNHFHILKYNARKSNSTIEEQTTYCMQGVRVAMQHYLDTPRFREKFACSGADGLDMRHLLRERKIVLLRFGLDTGPTGALLSRAIIESYYKAVLTMALTKDCQRTFVCLDEYQAMADLSNGAMSDPTFVSRAREFKSIFIAATQSMSALLNRGASAEAVLDFMNNCNTKIMLYTDDPLTQSMATRYNAEVALNELDPGQAFVVRYDKKSGRHLHGMQTFEKAYESVRKFETVEEEDRENADLVVTPKSPTLYILAKRAEAERTRLENEKKERRKSGILADANSTRPEASNIRRNREDWERRSAARADKSPGGSGPRHPLIEKFPEFFAEGARISLPHGWINFVERVFLAFSETGLEIQIKDMTIQDGTIHVRDDNSYLDMSRGAGDVLNRLLKPASEYCMACGAKMIPPKAEAKAAQQKRQTPAFDDDDEDDLDAELGIHEKMSPLCNECLKKFNIEPAEKKDTHSGI